MNGLSPSETLGVPGDPATRTCPWCDRPGVKAYEIFKTKAQLKRGIGTGQFLYPCARRNHQLLAEEASRPKERKAKNDAAD